MNKTIILSILLLSGCTTINFENGAASNKEYTSEKWHHNVVLGLIEVSDPVDLEKECANKEWDTVQTEVSFLNGLASTAVNFFFPDLVP